MEDAPDIIVFKPLAVAASLESFKSHASYNGSPCYLDNQIGRSVKNMATLQKRRKPFPHFYFIQCGADKVLDRSHAKRDFKGSLGKDYLTHGLKVFFLHRSTDWNEIKNLPLH